MNYSVCSNLYCLQIVRYLCHNLLNVCLIYWKHGVRHEIIISKMATLWTFFQNTLPAVSSSQNCPYPY